jgi:hypothetical protein
MGLTSCSKQNKKNVMAFGILVKISIPDEKQMQYFIGNRSIPRILQKKLSSQTERKCTIESKLFPPVHGFNKFLKTPLNFFPQNNTKKR